MKLREELTSSIVAHEEPVLFQKTKSGRKGYSLAKLSSPCVDPSQIIPSDYIRNEVQGFPEVSENEVVRHFVRLSQKNYSIDTGFYPLGSCTMKYNPKINEEIARNPTLAASHPFWPEQFLQPALAVQYKLQELLKCVTGLDAFTLQPTAGAHGEYAGLKVIAAYHADKKTGRNKILIPDSAHGTNPATCSMVDFETISIPTGSDGIVSLESVQNLMTPEVAGIMITNPNTLGLFEKNIGKISEFIHANDGLVYMDGANFNAILGIVRPADIGVDVMHINLHKTFSTPHGGGGPGAGPVGVRSNLAKYLPSPTVEKFADGFQFQYDMPKSVGRVGGYFGNFSIHIRALAYMLSIGTTPDESTTYLRRISEAAVLNANYIRHRLRNYFHIPFDSTCMHEVILSDSLQEQFGVKTLHIAKRLIDYGYHPMTVYFPLIVHGAMMIEPTESETKETLDQFCDVMIEIANEARRNPEILLNAPTFAFREKVDELKAQKSPRLRF